ncbi:branched-chain amino acid ABC transporter permease [Glaciimonas sp. GG7]
MNKHLLKSTWLWVVIAFALLALLPLMIASRMVLDLVIHIAIFGLFATAVNLLIGYTGLVSFGHAMFYASGAYGFGLLMQTGAYSVPAALALAVLGSVLIAVVVGLVCTHTKEIYFTFLTLAIQMMFYSTILSWGSLTGGDQGLTGGFNKPPFLGIDLANANHVYYFITGVVIVSLGLLWHITKSPFGYALRMIRDNAARVAFLGMNVRAYRLAAFVIAAAFASVAGALMSLYVSAAYPNFGYWTMSGEAIFMIMLGGVNTFLGPLVGAGMLTLLNHFVTEHTKYYGLVLGGIILLYVVFLQKGLLDLMVERFHAGRAVRRTANKSDPQC